MGTLTALKVKNAAPGRHGDGDGLYLLVKPSGTRSWVLRIQREGKRHDVGLGSVEVASRSPDLQRASDGIPILLRRQLTLGEAREKASELRRFAKAGLDPLVERDRERRKVPTFEEAAKDTHEALKAGWVKKNADAFLTSLETYAYPSLGKLPVDKIQASDIRDMIAPIWTSKPELARKVRMRAGQVLNFSHSKGWRPIDAPGKAVTVGLPKQPKGGNFNAMPYADVPALVQDLKGKAPTTGRRALLFLILTAARPGEVRFAKWGQIDVANRVWNRPAELMKLREPHTVTLNDTALVLLAEIRGDREVQPDELIFPGSNRKPLSDMTLNKLLRDAELKCDAHGFRSSFRDWAAEQMPQIPDAVAEAALAHAVPDKVIRAYKRTKFVEMRRKLLEAWGMFVCENAGGTKGQGESSGG